jgi:hypothetical protein
MTAAKSKTSARHRAIPLQRQAFLLCGTAEVPPPPWSLRAGPVEMLFDPATAFLRRLRVGGVELVRAIYGAVRDRNWGTVPPRISNLRPDISEDSFRLTFSVECREAAIDFRWHGQITGRDDGTVVFVFDGEARSTFLRNRIGLCVLHPLEECVGRLCTVEHTDGRLTHGRFPRLVAPHQPFKNIRAIAHEAASGLGVEVRFASETFEMEDQRNWTDASFKTYGTPLALPFPVEISAGTRVRQTVTVRLIGMHGPARKTPTGWSAGLQPALELKVSKADCKSALRSKECENPAPVRLTVDLSAARPLPPIGLGMASHGGSLTKREVERLRALRLAHLRVDVKVGEPDWPARLRQAAKESADIGVALEVALFLTDNAERELDALVAACREASANVARWLVFHAREKSTTRRWIKLAQRKLRAFDAAIPIAAGTDANFAELNRQRPPADLGVLPCFSINPQVHAFDQETLVENPAAQAHAVAAAHAFSRQPVVVSPITLRPRFNVVATAADTVPVRHELPSPVDARQMSLFGAAWTLGSLSWLAPLAEVHCLTFYETTGWRGVMEREGGSPLPEKFPSQPGAVFPVFHVFAALAGFGKVFPLRSSQPLTALGLGLVDAENRKRVLVANLSGGQREVELESCLGVARVRVLDETNVGHAAPKPVSFTSAFIPSLGLKPGGVRNGLCRFRLRRWAVAAVDFNSPP